MSCPTQHVIVANDLSASLVEEIENPILDKIMKEVIAEQNSSAQALSAYDEFADFPED